MSNGPLEGEKGREPARMTRVFAAPHGRVWSSGRPATGDHRRGGHVRVRKKGLSPKRKPPEWLERETGFEPATSTLARLHSTTELLPHAYGISRSFFMEATSRFELENGGFADLCLTTWLCRLMLWSGRRDLNPRLQPWQGCTLPLSYSRSTKEGSTLETPFLSSSFFHFAGK